jgi:hypothetical protein
VQGLKDKIYHVLIFIHANKDGQHPFHEQGDDVWLVIRNRFTVDDAHNGSMGIMMANHSLINPIKELNDGDLPNTHNSEFKHIYFTLCTDDVLEYIDRVGFLDPSVLGPSPQCLRIPVKYKKPTRHMCERGIALTS